MLSHLFWERYFHRDAGVLGAPLKLGGEVFTVIGVAAAGFSGQGAVPPAGWLPLPMGRREAAVYDTSGPQMFRLVGRLQPGISEAQAKADLDAIAAGWAKEFPSESAKTAMELLRGMRLANIPLTPLNLARLSPLFLGFGMVLVIACTNVANLLLARGVSRQAEIGVRLTLGASRGRIIRQLLTENLLVCVLGAAVGIGLGLGLLQVIKQIILAPILSASWLAFLTPVPDFRVLGYTALLTISTTLVAGLLPALHAARANLIAAVHNEGTAFGRRITPSRLRQWLVILQVALCLALLSCAGVLARNLLTRQKNVVLGMDARAVFRLSVWPNPAIADRALAFRQALETLQTIPGVEASGAVDGGPFAGRGVTARVRPVEAAAGGAGEETAGYVVTSGFFETFRIPVLRGRVFRELEQQATAHVIMVSESLARQLWPGQEAVGKTLAVSETTWSPRDRPAAAGAFRECEVIGVVGDLTIPFADGNSRLLYVPVALELPLRVPVFIRARSDSAMARTEIVRAAEAGNVELRFDRRVSDQIEEAVFPFYCLAVISGVLGVLALAMASVGLYGLMTFAINQRVREIGIRMALGATAGKVVGLFVRQGMRLVAIGLGFGLVGGALLALLLNAILFGFINTFDPVAFVAVTLLFAVIAMFACWLPARRAAKVDPMVALRAE